MNLHWDIFIKPALDCIDLNHVVEIGADTGQNTKNIIMYCRQRNARLTSIDCVASEKVLALSDEYDDCFTLVEKTSLDALPELSDYEAIMIDGDHNWYTVYSELKLIESVYENPKDFPLVFFHDIAWPYARRDMYYSPERIPDEFRQPYFKRGITPNQSELDEDQGWFNSHLCNATTEEGPRNGVLTGVEDFINESRHKFRLALFNGNSGIGILATDVLISKYPKLKHLFDQVDWAVPIGISMENQFKDMINTHVNNQTAAKNVEKHCKDLEQHVSDMRKTINALTKERDNFLNSTSWKVTKPLRYVVGFIKH